MLAALKEIITFDIYRVIEVHSDMSLVGAGATDGK